MTKNNFLTCNYNRYLENMGFSDCKSREMTNLTFDGTFFYGGCVFGKEHVYMSNIALLFCAVV